MDGRSTWGRRYRDVVESLAADLGGMEALTSAQLSMTKRAATLTCEIERHEAAFAERGEADSDALREFQTCVNTLRRTLESLGLARADRVSGSRTPSAPVFDGEGVTLTRTTDAATGRLRPMTADQRQLGRILGFAIATAVHEGARVPSSLADLAGALGLTASNESTTDAD